MANVLKLYPKPDCTSFDSFARIMSGTVRVGDRLRVLGEGYSPDDEEDCVVKEVTNLWIYQVLPQQHGYRCTLTILQGLPNQLRIDHYCADVTC